MFECVRVFKTNGQKRKWGKKDTQGHIAAVGLDNKMQQTSQSRNFAESAGLQI